MSRLMLFVLGMMLQACIIMSNALTTPSPEEEIVGVLERAKQAYRETKAKVLNVGSSVADLAGMYYEEHLKPVADSYKDWAREKASSLWDRLKDRVSTLRST
ncbi:apolipoprotein C-IV [Myxocyprinus asiaticus]|uniref:apolipoprotein C-IV n=1 Tax=Myxocyprinus asiaticus TaxID=70543 RepID=UPI0022231255|nr:apolipoprotein C-IV [Myxocyprinus asiaticus]